MKKRGSYGVDPEFIPDETINRLPVAARRCRDSMDRSMRDRVDDYYKKREGLEWVREMGTGQLIDPSTMLIGNESLEKRKEPTTMTQLPTDAQDRKNLPLATGVLDYFPLALAAVANVSRVGNEQHNPGEPLHWARGKSTDHADCLMRHLAERGTLDDDGVSHSSKAVWRALALLQEEEEKRLGVAISRGSVEEISFGEKIRSFIHDLPNGPLYFLGSDGLFMEPGPTATALIARHDSTNRAYIAGPMRGYPQYNFPAFLKADEKVKHHGFTTLNPAVIEMEGGLDPINHPEEAEARVAEFTDEDWLGVIIRDLGCILTLNPETDVLFVLDDWEKSTGSLAEVMLARWLGVQVRQINTMEPLTIVYMGDLQRTLELWVKDNRTIL